MDEGAMFDAVTAHRIALCDQLDGLTDAQWDVDSLCAGWKIRDVLGHLVTLQDVPTYRFVIGVVSRSGFDRRIDRFARECGRRAPDVLLSQYRSRAESRKAPPVIGPIAPLTDVVVHSLDVQRPLGLEPLHTEEVARTVLDALCAGFPGFTAKRLVRGLRFEATDLAWSTGDGPTVVGTASDLLLALMGRADGMAALTGEGATALASRL